MAPAAAVSSRRGGPGAAIANQRGAAADLDRIRTAGLYLLTLIGDVLDLSTIEAGGMTLLLERVAVRPAVDAAVALAWPLMAVNRNTFHGAVPRDGLSVMADPTFSWEGHKWG